jgi:diguanylate cyclase (GGDEF)-like protein
MHRVFRPAPTRDAPFEERGQISTSARAAWLRRLASAAAVTGAYLLFQQLPLQLDLGDEGKARWALVWWVVTPLATAALCVWVASRASPHDRRAFQAFGIGSFLWAVGTLTWQFVDTEGFPGWSDVAYLGTCLSFAVGTFQYSATDRVISRLQLCTFAVAQSAVAIAVSLLLLPAVQASKLTAIGTLVACLYPMAWGGAAAFATLCVCLYASPRRRFVVGVLLAGLLAQGAADTLYAFDLMGASYVVGSSFDGLWILAFLLIGWAATDHKASFCRDEHGSAVPSSKRQQRAEAFIPAGAILLIAAAGSFPGVIALGPISVWMLPLTIVFAVSLGLRQHWSLLDERQLRDEAAASREGLALVLESTTDSVLVINRDWEILYVNQQARQFLSKVEGFRLGASIWDLYPETSRSNFRKHYERAFSTQEPVVFQDYVSEAGLWVSVHAYPKEDILSVFFRDITEHHKNASELEFLAHHDPLTHLSNREVFERQLGVELEVGGEVAILWLDLDDFKTVNDSLGHPVGDQLLIKIASRLRACVPSARVVARIGGDEFAVLLTDDPVPEKAAQRIIEALGHPVELEGRSISAAASIGIARTGDHRVSASDLIKQADIALYRAKADGRRSVRLFEPKMQTDLLAREARRTELVAALEKSEFELLYQPIVDLHLNRVTSFEALLRWRHPELGLVLPTDFIPIAEETGLIAPIGEWVLRQACLDAHDWPSPISVSVNLSPVQFRNRNLIDDVGAALRRAGLDAHRLELEITESVLLNDSETNLHLLNTLRQSGVGIVLDDFGTGYSSLAYIQRFAFSKIKIDRSFISDIASGPKAQAIVRCIAQLGQALHVDITAEGVETRQQLGKLREIGCTQAQGYLFSRPVPALAVLPLISRLQSRSFSEPDKPRHPTTRKRAIAGDQW